MSLISSLDISSISVGDLKEEDVISIFDTFMSTDKLANARQLLNMIRKNQIDSLPEEVVGHLIKSVLDEKLRPRLKEICFAVLEYLVETVKLPIDKLNVDENALADCTEYLLWQESDTTQTTWVIDKFLGILNDPASGSSLKSKVLSFFSKLAETRIQLFSSETIQALTSFLLQWLCGSKSADAFSKTPYTELDGVPSQDLFTVLNLVQNVNSDHMLHHQVFSMIRLWLHNCHGLKINKSRTKKRDLCETVPFPDGAMKKLLEYCLRLIDQVNRAPPKPPDISSQNTCLIEALSIMNMICLADESNIPVVYQVVRRVFDKNCIEDNVQIESEDFAVVMECLQFFKDHGKVVGYGAFTAIESILRNTSHGNVLEPFYSFTMVSFLRENHKDICENSEIFEKNFPALLKLFSWHPNALLEEFKVLVPTFISVATAVEVFHSIIDLPCVCGALFLEKYAHKPLTIEPNPEIVKIQEMSQTAPFKAMFNFILRSKSGIGDTFSKIGELHRLQSPLVSLKCIEECANAACVLLDKYFEVILMFLDYDLASRIMPAILERSVLLLDVSGFTDNVQKIMDDAMLKIVKKHPFLLVEHQIEFLDYISIVRHLVLAENIYSHVVWFFGEYMSTSHLDSCQADIITACYESLECVMYEVVGSHKDKAYSYRTICILAMSLAKLASRCQDLVPRVMLCLTKVVKEIGTCEDDNQEYKDIVLNRLNELRVVLKMPNITSAVFSPGKEIEKGEWHRDNFSVPAVVKSVNTILGQDVTSYT